MYAMLVISQMTIFHVKNAAKTVISAPQIQTVVFVFPILLISMALVYQVALQILFKNLIPPFVVYVMAIVRDVLDQKTLALHAILPFLFSTALVY